MYITTRDSDIENPRAPNFSYATSLLCINNFLSVGNIVIFRMRWVPNRKITSFNGKFSQCNRFSDFSNARGPFTISLLVIKKFLSVYLRLYDSRYLHQKYEGQHFLATGPLGSLMAKQSHLIYEDQSLS